MASFRRLAYSSSFVSAAVVFYSLCNCRVSFFISSSFSASMDATCSYSISDYPYSSILSIFDAIVGLFG